MPRIARVVVPGYPHHVTQRGNRRQRTFFCDDYRAYLALMAEWCMRCGVEIWAYCLLPNHVHLIAVPNSEEGLRRGIAAMPPRPATDSGVILEPCRKRPGECQVAPTNGAAATIISHQM